VQGEPDHVYRVQRRRCICHRPIARAADKLELISRIWEDVRVRGEFRPSDNDLAEIKRRSAEYEAGKVKAVPLEQVRDEIRQKLKELKAND
jgi:putative addiction module component (TIGR02574 family)